MDLYLNLVYWPPTGCRLWGREQRAVRVLAGMQSDHENIFPRFGRQTSARTILSLTVPVAPVLGVVDFYSEIQQGRQHMLLKAIASL